MYLKNRSLIKLNVTKKQVTIGWILAASTLITVQYINVIWHYGHIPWNQIFAAFWAAIEVLLWSLGTGWIIFASSSSSPGSFSSCMNSILSWPPFRPLARVSYMVYLTHMILIWSYSASRSTLVEMSSFTGIYIFVPHVVFAYILGFICTILVESPFLEIQKLCLQRHNRIRKEEGHNRIRMKEEEGSCLQYLQEVTKATDDENQNSGIP